jgi:hypothetical protein
VCVGPYGQQQQRPQENTATDPNQNIDEIVNGGNLFGERNLPGLKDIYKLTDNEHLFYFSTHGKNH